MYHHLIYYLIFLRFTFASSSTQIEINKLQITIEEQYATAKYEAVLQTYDSLQVRSPLIPPAISLYAAHAAEQLGDTATAMPIYRHLSELNLPEVSPIALNQLGIQAMNSKHYQLGLDCFKKALLIDETYKPASYNFELAYKRFPPKSSNMQSQVQKPQQVEQNFEQAIVTQQNEEKKDLLSQSVPPRMERERALQLLDAMRADELQNNPLKRLGGKSKKSEKNW